MHILFLTDNFPPEGNAPASRTFEHAREWVKLGQSVTVVTGVPNFPEGKIFPGYKNKIYQVEEIEGINVIRVITYISANEGIFKRTLDFLSFMVISFFAGLFVKKVDVVVGTSPQFFTVISAWLLAKSKRIPFVFELRDIWPASITAVGALQKNRIIRFFECLEMFLYKQADLIVSVTNSFKSELIERGVDGDKITVILNGVDLSTYSPVTQKDIELAKQFGLLEKFVVGYVGTHGMAHALDNVLQAASLLQEYPEILFLFAGGGAYKSTLDKLISELNLNNVVSIQRQPKSAMPRLWSLCDVSLISLKNVPLFESVIPSKIFESMGMGLPMIASIPEGEASKIIEDAGAGVLVAPECVNELANEILELYKNKTQLKDMASSSYKYSVHYSRKALAETMLVNLESLVNQTRKPS